MIVIKELNKYYKSGGQNFHALKDINLEFSEVGMNFILGKSGSGKSTLLNVIGGIDTYDSGEIIVDGISTKKFSSKQFNTYRNSYVGFIFQEFNVLKSLSVYENIALSLELQHENVKQKDEEIRKIIDLVGLTSLEQRMMNELSGGQRQRVAIARSLIKNPKLLIADEPTGNLDAKNSTNVMNLLKDLAKDRLVIIVTHNEELAHNYADRIIELKDGEIINDTIIHDDVLNNNSINTTSLNDHFISVPLKTSLHLSFKGIIKSLKRFIFIALLFTIALVFAGVVINMTLANTTLTYAKYQDEFNNNVVGLDSEFKSNGYTTRSAFFKFQKDLFTTTYAQTDATYSLIEGMKYDIPINQNATESNEFYATSISMVYNKLTLPKSVMFHTTNVSNSNEYVKAYITDYVAQCLIYNNYFNDDTIKKPSDLTTRRIKVASLNKPIVICGIIDTNYKEFEQYFSLNGDVKSDSKAQAAFFDNSLFYNALFLDNVEYEKMFSVDNIKYFYNDVIYNMVADTGTAENVLFTTYPEIDEDDEPLKIAKGTAIPTKHAEGEPLQLAVTTGFFEKVLNITIDDNQITDEESKADLLFKKIHYDILVHPEGDEGVMQSIFATNFLCLTRYIPTNLTFIITTIVEDDDPIVYFAYKEESNDYSQIISSVFFDGNCLTLYFSENENLSKSEYLNTNAQLYRKFINNDIIITNISYTKILLVDSFINENLPLFIGIFFVFALFSVLLIFNFVIINIKNNTKDIGIYMSLGFSGWKIALIYLFQVIIIGLASFILSQIGTSIFLLVLDAHFTKLASVNLSIIKMTFSGVSIVLLMSLLIPTVSVIVPLINLSRKNPVDVIKSI